MSLMTRRSAALSLASLSLPAWAQAVQLRIGTVVPKNSTHHQLLLELGEGWRAAQGAGAKVVVFTDGSQGGEHELVRRMRIGQLQGAMMSVVGLREIEPSMAALQTLPLLFRNWEELDHGTTLIEITRKPGADLAGQAVACIGARLGVP